MLTVFINIVGIGRESGKTTLIETIIQRLSDRFNIWTLKHISTSFDTADKDTWRHLHAGAKTVIAVTGNEIVTIKKSSDTFLDEDLREIPESVDLLLIEGFKKSDCPKIIVAQNIDDARKVLGDVSRVFAIHLSEASASDLEAVDGKPVLKLEALVSKVEKMVLSNSLKKLPGLNCKRCGFPTCEGLADAISKGEATLDQCNIISDETINLTVDGKHVFLSSFPREIIRNIILGMVDSLKNIERKKGSNITLEIKC
ncbi:MAG: molybdopterin-guanine dinucleotide biosynthesis protein B [Candidatus Bathyarchaeota archaeon]